jgi:hypothetical protein
MTGDPRRSTIRVAGGCPGGPGLVVGELAFEGGEEAFREGIVPALALTSERQRDLAVPGEACEPG